MTAQLAAVAALLAEHERTSGSCGEECDWDAFDAVDLDEARRRHAEHLADLLSAAGFLRGEP